MRTITTREPQPQELMQAEDGTWKYVSGPLDGGEATIRVSLVERAPVEVPAEPPDEEPPAEEPEAATLWQGFAALFHQGEGDGEPDGGEEPPPEPEAPEEEPPTEPEEPSEPEAPADPPPVQELARVRLEFAGGGAVTYGHPELATVLTEHTQGHTAAFSLTGRTMVRYRVYEDRLKHEIVLLADPGTNTFEEVAWLEDCSLIDVGGGRWEYVSRAGLSVGAIPPLIVYASRPGAHYETEAALDVIPQGDGSLLLRMTVDEEWLAERWAEGCIVVIDPTTIGMGSDPLNQSRRRTARLADGTLLTVLNVDLGSASFVQRLYISVDEGQTWQIATTPANGIVSTQRGFVVVEPDADKRVHALIGTGPYTGRLLYQHWTLNAERTGVTIVETQVEGMPGTNRSWWNGALCVWGTAGQTKNLAIAYSNVHADPATENLYARTATVTTAGVLTLGTRQTKLTYTRSGNHVAFDLCRNSGNDVRILYSSNQIDSTRVWVAPISGSSTTLTTAQQLEPIVGVDGLPGFLWVGAIGGRVEVWSDTGFKAATPHNHLSGMAAAIADVANNRILLLGRRGSAVTDTGYPGLWTYSIPGNQFTDLGAISLERQVRASTVQTIRSGWDGFVLPFIYTEDSSPNTVVFDAKHFNSQPSAPVLHPRPNFDATEAAVLSWDFKDPDPGDAQTAAQVQIQRTSDGATVVDTGKVASTVSEYNLTANTLQNAHQYQWRVRTWDNTDTAGAWSTWSPFYCAARPTGTILFPAAHDTIGGARFVARHAYSDAAGLAQAAFQYRLLSETNAELWSSGKVSSVNGRELEIGFDLANDTAYRLELTVWSNRDVASAPVVAPFAVSYTAPLPAQNIRLTADAAIAAIRVRWQRGQHLAGTFTRASVAYLSDGMQVANGAPRYEAGWSGRGLFIEEGVSNLLQSNISRCVGGWQDWIAVSNPDNAGKCTFAQNANGEEKAVIDVIGNMSGLGRVVGHQGLPQPSTLSGKTVTWQVEVTVEGLTDGRLYLAVEDTDGTGYVSSRTPDITTNGTYKLAVTRQLRNNLTSSIILDVYFQANVGTKITIRRAQFAEKAYATSWQIGGTARAPESFSTPSTNLLTPVRGTVALRLYVNAMTRRQVAGQNNRLLHIHGPSTTGLAVMHEPNLAEWRLFTGTDGGVITQVRAPDSHTPDGWHLFMVTWTPQAARLYINGFLRGTIPNPNLPSMFGDIFVGRHPIDTWFANTAFDSLTTWNDELTAAEAAALAALAPGHARTALPNQDHLTAWFPFDGDLSGGNQNEAFSGMWRVESQEVGADAWNPLGTVGQDEPTPDGPQTVEYIDYSPGSGREYRYRVVALGANGTETGVVG